MGDARIATNEPTTTVLPRCSGRMSLDVEFNSQYPAACTVTVRLSLLLLLLLTSIKMLAALRVSKKKVIGIILAGIYNNT